VLAITALAKAIMPVLVNVWPISASKLTHCKINGSMLATAEVLCGAKPVGFNDVICDFMVPEMMEHLVIPNSFVALVIHLSSEFLLIFFQQNFADYLSAMCFVATNIVSSFNTCSLLICA
jgi:hypothetical protein